MNFPYLKQLPLLCLSVCLLAVWAPLNVSAMSSAEEASPVFRPRVLEVSGPVTVKGGKYSIWEPAEAGMLLLSGDVLKTERGGSARIRFASGEVEIYEETVVAIPHIVENGEKLDVRELFVEEGKAFFDINPTGVRKGFQFRTKNVQGGVKGTLFSVSYLKQGTAVNVYRGEVFVSDLDGTPETMRTLTKGRALRVDEVTDFGKVKRFDPGPALDDYRYNVPPGLDSRGLPADYNANRNNRGKRKRGRDSSDAWDNDQGDNDQGDNDQGDNDQGDNEQ